MHHFHTCIYTLDPNDITAPPQQYALVGQNYTLLCNTSLANSFISSGRTGQLRAGTLTIKSIQLQDEGVYSCRVTVMAASIEKTIQLTVISKPILFQMFQTLAIVHVMHKK